jgi:hypothetical protein
MKEINKITTANSHPKKTSLPGLAGLKPTQENKPAPVEMQNKDTASINTDTHNTVDTVKIHLPQNKTPFPLNHSHKNHKTQQTAEHTKKAENNKKSTQFFDLVLPLHEETAQKLSQKKNLIHLNVGFFIGIEPITTEPILWTGLKHQQEIYLQEKNKAIQSLDTLYAIDQQQKVWKVQNKLINTHPHEENNQEYLPQATWFCAKNNNAESGVFSSTTLHIQSGSLLKDYTLYCQGYGVSTAINQISLGHKIKSLEDKWIDLDITVANNTKAYSAQKKIHFSPEEVSLLMNRNGHESIEDIFLLMNQYQRLNHQKNQLTFSVQKNNFIEKIEELHSVKPIKKDFWTGYVSNKIKICKINTQLHPSSRIQLLFFEILHHYWRLKKMINQGITSILVNEKDDLLYMRDEF